MTRVFLNMQARKQRTQTGKNKYTGKESTNEAPGKMVIRATGGSLWKNKHLEEIKTQEEEKERLR